MTQIQAGLKLFIIEDILIHDLEVIRSLLAEKCEVLLGLHLNVLQAAVHHVCLLQVEKCHAARHLGEYPFDKKLCSNYGMEYHGEEQQLLCKRPSIVLLGGEDKHHNVCDRCQDAINIECRVPRLIGSHL